MRHCIDIIRRPPKGQVEFARVSGDSGRCLQESKIEKSKFNCMYAKNSSDFDTKQDAVLLLILHWSMPQPAGVKNWRNMVTETRKRVHPILLEKYCEIRYSTWEYTSFHTDKNRYYT